MFSQSRPPATHNSAVLEVLIEREVILARVAELGREIERVRAHRGWPFYPGRTPVPRASVGSRMWYVTRRYARWHDGSRRCASQSESGDG